ncbi:hypothetical protein [Prauserella marina]|uniref:hypothetical protein n=1 Tax=Prauserella marina TaxID=530584 RepID=UPI000D7107FE|nr:hypothetical protein [Prauserella marina]
MMTSKEMVDTNRVVARPGNRAGLPRADGPAQLNQSVQISQPPNTATRGDSVARPHDAMAEHNETTHDQRRQRCGKAGFDEEDELRLAHHYARACGP